MLSFSFRRSSFMNREDMLILADAYSVPSLPVLPSIVLTVSTLYRQGSHQITPNDFVAQSVTTEEAVDDRHTTCTACTCAAAMLCRFQGPTDVSAAAAFLAARDLWTVT